MKLWLVRHAQPLVASGICYGRLDVAADAPATAQCAHALAGLLPPGTRVRSSPLQRCEQLASALYGLRPDLAYKIEPRLQEMDFGQWEGRAWLGIAPAELAAWTDDFADHAVGHSGECVRGFMARVGAVIDSLQGPSDTLWITHAGVIRAVDLLAQGVRHPEQASQWPLDAPNYGQWRTLVLPIGQAQTNST
ncbi:histidine phosphatase family protein [Polaromonas sp.]|uniref:histidine phosphatase family protein n=1 Tax=Polaromonas sp. TaxID=1869339 RepID=UPI001DA8DE45|nr:histidine phosphatase family protein [Polaromonas sp.]MBT9476812.1 histidine phosphatase family protein [Polaromonas sp.]